MSKIFNKITEFFSKARLLGGETSGRLMSIVGLKNVLGTPINPSTSEKQDEQTVVLELIRTDITTDGVAIKGVSNEIITPASQDDVAAVGSAITNGVQVRNFDGTIINPATEGTLQSIAGLNLPPFDSSHSVETSATIETHTFYTGTYGVDGVLVATVVATFSDDTKTFITDLVKTLP